jgi:hypothetical protein
MPTHAPPAPGLVTPDVLALLAAASVSFLATTHALHQVAPPPVPLALRDWLELAFVIVSTAGCGTFFTWLVHRLDRLRAHEHRQNNHMTTLMLQSEQHADDLAKIRTALGIPRR